MYSSCGQRLSLLSFFMGYFTDCSCVLSQPRFFTNFLSFVSCFLFELRVDFFKYRGLVFCYSVFASFQGILDEVEFSVSLQLNFSFKPPKDAVSVVTVCPCFSWFPSWNFCLPCISYSYSVLFLKIAYFYEKQFTGNHCFWNRFLCILF